MKRIQMFSVLCLLTAAMDATAQGGPGPVMPSDFNFVFQYEHAHMLDTSKGRHKRWSTSSVLAYCSHEVNSNGMEDIFRSLVSIDFWNYGKYPEIFRITPKGNSVLIAPSDTEYLLRLTGNGEVKRVRWQDKILEYYQPAAELREVFKKIRLIIESKPEYKSLPPSQVKYID